MKSTLKMFILIVGLLSTFTARAAEIDCFQLKDSDQGVVGSKRHTVSLLLQSDLKLRDELIVTAGNVRSNLVLVCGGFVSGCSVDAADQSIAATHSVGPDGIEQVELAFSGPLKIAPGSLIGLPTDDATNPNKAVKLVLKKVDAKLCPATSLRARPKRSEPAGRS